VIKQKITKEDSGLDGDLLSEFGIPTVPYLVAASPDADMSA